MIRKHAATPPPPSASRLGEHCKFLGRAAAAKRFLPRDAMLARHTLLSCVRLPQAGIVSKRLDESRWFLAWMLPSTYSTLCYQEIWVSPKVGILPSGTLSPKSHGKSIALSTQVDVYNNHKTGGWGVGYVDFNFGVTSVVTQCSVVFFLDPRVGHTMDVLSPFISVLCHSH